MPLNVRQYIFIMWSATFISLSLFVLIYLTIIPFYNKNTIQLKEIS